MTIEVYGVQGSPPTRIVQLCLEAVGKKYERIKTDIHIGEHMKPEYLKLNPQHNIPTLKDGDFVINESRAIIAYLANKYGNASLYPKDFETRARVDQRLYFDMGALYQAYADCAFPQMFEKKIPDPSKFDRLRETIGWANDFVKPTGFVAGTQSYTIADLSILSTYGTIVHSEIVDLSGYKELNAWFEKMKGLVPNYEDANGEGAEAFGSWYRRVKLV